MNDAEPGWRIRQSSVPLAADEGSSRKRRNREHEEAHLCATLNDHVSNGERAEQSEVKRHSVTFLRRAQLFTIAMHTPQQRKTAPQSPTKAKRSGNCYGSPRGNSGQLPHLFIGGFCDEDNPSSEIGEGCFTIEIAQKTLQKLLTSKLGDVIIMTIKLVKGE